MENRITFCINTANNEKDYVSLLLRSLVDHTSIDDHEVLVFVDSDNQGSYEHILTKKSEIKNLRVHRNTAGFPVGSQTNVSVMFNKAKNDIVCYLQSDMVVGKDFDKHIIKNITEKTVLSCARIEPPIHPESYDKITKDFGITPDSFNYEQFNSFVEQLQSENRLNIETHFAPFAIHKKTWFEYMGGFDVQFRCSREDSDTMIRMREAGLNTIQCWNACVYHFTCVSSRGTGWFENSAESNRKNLLQKRADQEELKRFIRKWGYFGHHYKPRYSTTLVIDVDTGVDIELIKQIEPYFGRLVLNDKEAVGELIRRIEYETDYYANKRWRYTYDYWVTQKHRFRPIDFYKRIKYEANLESVYDNVIIRISMLDLLKINQDVESQGFITNNNDILNGLISNGEVSTGTYETGLFKIIVNDLVDINRFNMKPDQYLIKDIDSYNFT